MGIRDKLLEYGRRLKAAIDNHDESVAPQRLESHDLIDDAYRRGVLRDRVGPEHVFSPANNAISGPIGGAAQRKLVAVAEGRYVPEPLKNIEARTLPVVKSAYAAAVPLARVGAPVAHAIGGAVSPRAMEAGKRLNEAATGKPFVDRRQPAVDPDNPGTEVPTPPEAIKELERQLAEQREKLRKGGS